MKLRHVIAASIVCILMYHANAMASDYDIKYIDAKSNVAQNKNWTVKFNKELNASTVTKGNIEVLNSSGQTVPVTLSLNSDNMSINVSPDSNYEQGQTYTLCVEKSVCSESNCELPKEVRMNFTIVSSSGDDSGSSSSTTVDPDLVEAAGKMDTIKDEVKTQSEKNLVDAIKSALAEKMDNPSEPTDTSAIKSQYAALSDEEKSDLQTVFLQNLSLSTLLEIKGMF